MTSAIDATIVGEVEGFVMFVLWWVLLAVKLFATCDAVFRSHEYFVAADKQNKAFWLLILVVFLALHLFSGSDPRNILSLIGLVAALVYLADVRPILRSMQHR